MKHKKCSKTLNSLVPMCGMGTSTGLNENFPEDRAVSKLGNFIAVVCSFKISAVWRVIT